MSQFKIQGAIPLKGEVTIGGSKNATLPILAASLLTNEKTTLNNVPDISDVHAFLSILNSLGVKTTFTPASQGSNEGPGATVTIDPSGLSSAPIPHDLVKHMRASILLLGPLLGRFNEVKLAFPGGCVLGKRSISAHLHAFQDLGASLVNDEKTGQPSDEAIHLKGPLKAAKFIMGEASVTATENAIMAAVMTPGETEIRWAAMEPHVQDLCLFLVNMGADIQGIGTHTLKIKGGQPLTGSNYSVTPDYLEAGTFILAAVLTNGEVTVNNCPIDHLDSFWQKLEEVGAEFTLIESTDDSLPGTVEIHKHNGLHAIEKLQTSVFPGFATDLQAPFAVLLTQCQGTTKLHETLFEGRLNYLAELERMGAKVQILNPHQAIIEGATPLQGAPIVSHDIRAGAAMVLAALTAEGETTISDINYIDRGYENLEEKLRALGANITREL
jgi:UDP-N-acetylglucosamine 1-carboxyvinyltransferase